MSDRTLSSGATSNHCPLAVLMLATCNGAPWLPQLLDSLLAQDYPNLLILARDDNSDDESGDILASYQQAARGRLVIVKNDDAGNVGAKANFAALSSAALTAGESSAESLYLFCDQDDIWHPNKVSVLARHMPAAPAAIPAMCYCDMQVVDSRQQPLAGSFIEYQSLSRSTRLPRLLVQNHISGCALMFNRAALELATPIASAALMHDWWLALLVAAAGRVGFYDGALLDYRQHASNSVGASGYNMRYVLGRGLSQGQGQGPSLADLYLQASATRERLLSKGIDEPACIAAFSETRHMPLPLRALRLWQGGFTKKGYLRNLPLLFSPTAGHN